MTKEDEQTAREVARATRIAAFVVKADETLRVLASEMAQAEGLKAAAQALCTHPRWKRPGPFLFGVDPAVWRCPDCRAQVEGR